MLIPITMCLDENEFDIAANEIRITGNSLNIL